jgi:phosphonate transport system substrate-binding protein
MRRRFARLSIAALGLATVLVLPAAAQWRETIPTVRVGVLAGLNPSYLQSQLEPFRSYLEDRLGIAVELVPAADYPTMMAAQMAGGLQIAFLSASAFAATSVACDACVEPLVVPTTPDGIAGYHAILVVPAGSPIDGPADLNGRRLAVSAADSIAGRLLPLRLFAEAGVPETAIQLIERASPEAAIAAMLAGEADAALAWSSLTGDRAAGFAVGALAQMVATATLTMDQIGIAWTSPLIPYAPLSVQASLPADFKADLATAMTGLRAADPEAYAAIDRGHGGGFVPADAAMFAPLLLLATPAAAP